MFWKRKTKTQAEVAVSKSPHAALMEKFNALYVPSGHGNYYRFSEYKGSNAEAGYIEFDPKDRPDFLIHYVKNPPLGPHKNNVSNWNVTETFGKLLRRKAEFTPSPLQTMFKGLVWGMAQFHDEKSLAAIAALAEKCFERIKGIGPAAPALGNACIYTLSASKGLSGVAHLSRLKLRVKQNNTQRLIQKKIDENAARLGLKPAQIEEMAAPDFGLDLGLRDYDFKDYTLRLDARKVGEAKLGWIKPDGMPQKSVPSFVKDSETLKAQLTAIRATAKNIKKASTAQRDRIDRLYTEDMSWSEDAHREAYLDHGLIGPMARNLIWQLVIKGQTYAALFWDGH